MNRSQLDTQEPEDYPLGKLRSFNEKSGSATQRRFDMRQNRHVSGGSTTHEEWFVTRFYEGIRITSSTALGIEASKRKPGKPRLGISGVVLEHRIRVNTHRVARIILRAIQHEWNPSRVLRALIDATHVGFSPRLAEYRTFSTVARYGVPPRDIPRHMAEFRRELNRLLDEVEPVTLAAWAEFQFDEIIHPISDGCGRVSKALGAWILARRGLPPPRYGSRKAYLTAIAEGPRAFTRYYRDACRSTPEEIVALEYLMVPQPT